MNHEIRFRFLAPFFFLLAIFVCARCAVMGGKPVYPSKINAEMELAFATAENHYKSARYQQALEAYQKFVRFFPYTRLTDESWYKTGKIHFLNGEWDRAIDSFQLLFSRSPDPSYRARANLLSAHSAYKKGDFYQAGEFLDHMKPADLPEKLQLRYYSLEVKVGNELGVLQRELDYFFLRMADLYAQSADRSLGYLKDEDLFSQQEVMERVQSWVISPVPADNIPAWFKNYPGDFGRGYVEYKLGKIYYEAGMEDRAKSRLAAFLRAYPKHKYADSAQKILKELGGEVKVASGSALRIGVLLPLSGAGASYGQATLSGVRCGAGKEAGCQRILTQMFGELPDIDLVVKDSGSDPAGISGLVDELVDADVSAVIGPMSAALALEAARRAEDVRMVLLPVTQKTGLMRTGDHIFQMSYEIGDQASDLVRTAMERGLKSFGIFSPAGSYGREMAEIFEKEVKSQGGKITAKAEYNPNAADLSSAARKLKLGVDRISFEGGPGFSALFVPDIYWMLGRVLPALKLVNITGIPLLGTNAWNDAKLPAELFADYPGSFFLDIFRPTDGSPLAGQFVSGFSASFGRTPSTIEAIGFDAVSFLWQAARYAGSTKKGKIRDALLLIKDLKGVTGIRYFEKGLGPVVQPAVISVSGSLSVD